MHKNAFAITLVCLVLSACSTEDTQAQSARAVDLTFIHLNDTYRVGAVEDGQRGGLSRVATIVSALQETGREVRILHGGDFLYPSLESQLWGGEQMVEAFNFLDALAPMLVVPGNHEFDPRTPDSLMRALAGSQFEWLGDNLQLATGDADADATMQNKYIFTAGERKVGIFSLTLHADDGGNVRDYAVIDRNYFDIAEQAIVGFEAAGADLIIGLTHLDLANDREIAALKQRHPTFMFIVGGHEHEPEYYAGTGASAELMKGASNARTIWQIDVIFDDDGAAEISSKMIAVDESIALHAGYEPIVDKWRARLLEKLPFLPSKIGLAAQPLDSREVTVRNEESNWGNFIADQMLIAFRGPPAELAFINSGTLRIDDYIAGEITFEDIGRTFGFSSYLRYMTVRGADFRDILEAGYRGSGPSKGYFPQLAGFRVCIDRSRREGQRIVQLQVRDGESFRGIENDREYSVVAPDYIFRGGDGYDFSKAQNISKPGSELQYLVLDAILNAQAQGQAIGKAVDPERPRIAFLETGVSVCF
jgi:2',3'-cyclic-nucleotide 2'-phosphodiesterase (5'-nucleotidase family)